MFRETDGRARNVKRVDLEGFSDWIVPSGVVGPLLRFGGLGDGAYLVPDDLVGIQACFSPGVANRKNFEDDILDRFKIRSHMMDASSNPSGFKTPLREPYQTFKKKWLEPRPGSEDTVSMEEWVAELEPGEGDLLLQMDIEGAEYRNIASWPEALLGRFRIIVVELHGLGQIAQNAKAFEKEKLPSFSRLMKTHTVVHAHPNNAGGSVRLPFFPFEIPRVLEITLLRNDRLKFWRTGHEGFFESPHSLDIGWNVAAKPPLFLGDPWMRETELTQVELRRIAINAAWSYDREAELQEIRLQATKMAVAHAGWKGWTL